MACHEEQMSSFLHTLYRTKKGIKMNRLFHVMESTVQSHSGQHLEAFSKRNQIEETKIPNARTVTCLLITVTVVR